VGADRALGVWGGEGSEGYGSGIDNKNGLAHSNARGSEVVFFALVIPVKGIRNRKSEKIERGVQLL
jgi:hypothetical protein